MEREREKEKEKNSTNICVHRRLSMVAQMRYRRLCSRDLEDGLRDLPNVRCAPLFIFPLESLDVFAYCENWSETCQNSQPMRKSVTREASRKRPSSSVHKRSARRIHVNAKSSRQMSQSFWVPIPVLKMR